MTQASKTMAEKARFPSRYFFGQQQSQEVPIRPTFLLGPNGNLLVDPAHVRQVEAPEVYLELPLGEFQTFHRVVVLLVVIDAPRQFCVTDSAR